jgi:predicted transcriptional regulator
MTFRLSLNRCYHSSTNLIGFLVRMPSTTLKLPENLKTRIARLAKTTKRSPHSLMIEALEREISREERMQDFVREALTSDANIEAGGAVYRAEDVHDWLKRLAHDGKARRPRQWRK